MGEIISSLATLPKLEKIDLEYMNKAYATQLSQALPNWKNLKALNLSSSDFGSELSAKILYALPESLEELDLSWNKMDPNLTIKDAFEKVLPKLKKLTKLNIECNPLSPEILISIFQNLPDTIKEIKHPDYTDLETAKKIIDILCERKLTDIKLGWQSTELNKRSEGFAEVPLEEFVQEDNATQFSADKHFLLPKESWESLLKQTSFTQSSQAYDSISKAPELEYQPQADSIINQDTKMMGQE